MKKSIAILLTVTLLLAVCAGCASAPKAISMPTLNPLLKKAPVYVKSTPLAEAFMKAIDYSVRDYVRQVTWGTGGIQYISMNIDQIKTLSASEKKDVAKFMEGYGIPFDQQGLDSKRSITERQNGIEMKVAESSNPQFYEEGMDLYLEVTLYTGNEGEGYFAYFKKHRKDYVLVECTNWMSYPYR